MNIDNRIFSEAINAVSSRGVLIDEWLYSPTVSTCTYQVGDYKFEIKFTENSMMVKEFYLEKLIHKMVRIFGKVVLL